jgi:hypothetical protein
MVLNFELKKSEQLPAGAGPVRREKQEEKE